MNTLSKKKSHDRGSIKASLNCTLLHLRVSFECRIPCTRAKANFLSSGVRNFAVWGLLGSTKYITIPQMNVTAPKMMKRNFETSVQPPMSAGWCILPASF